MSLVTLTFDNGPCPKTTPGVLRQLRELNLKAYFCLVGLQLEKGQEQIDIAKETLALGHTLVNHSFTHGVALGDESSRSHARREVTDTHRLLCERIGEWGEPWFRPFGRGGEVGQHLLSEAAVSELEALKYSVLLWNSVPRDWEDVHGWVATALAHVAAQEHTVIVLHDLDTGAMQHLEKFLAASLERGDVFTHELPEDCVPMRVGALAWEARRFASLVTA
jgi:peptidoglycan/xylan/chitin deacetylase (PgdA/CDA1 family)